MSNNCGTEPPGFESVPHHTQLYTMNGSSMQGQIVSLEAYHGELGHPILKEKLARIIQSFPPQIHVALLKTVLVWPHEASARVGIYSTRAHKNGWLE